jgi:hypothetical protein
MALFVANQAEAIFLNNALRKQTGEDIDIRLYSNNLTPGAANTESDYTEVSGGGYTANNLTAVNWGITGTNPTTATYGNTVSFLFTGAPTTNGGYVYGYYATARTGANAGKLLFADRFTNAPIIIANNGDEIRITTLTIGLNNATE